MASADVINVLIATFEDAFIYLLPIIGVLAGINFLVTWIMSITMGLGKRTFGA